MSDSEHTPGPWQVNYDAELDGFKFRSATGDVANAIVSCPQDASLMAAAPDLHSTLAFLLDRLNSFADGGLGLDQEQTREWYGHVEPAIGRARAALSKAEGEE